jgi:hypothetical protein
MALLDLAGALPAARIVAASIACQLADVAQPLRGLDARSRPSSSGRDPWRALASVQKWQAARGCPRAAQPGSARARNCSR